MRPTNLPHFSILRSVDTSRGQKLTLVEVFTKTGNMLATLGGLKTKMIYYMALAGRSKAGRRRNDIVHGACETSAVRRSKSSCSLSLTPFR